MIERGISKGEQGARPGSVQYIWSKVLRATLQAALAEGYTDTLPSDAFNEDKKEKVRNSKVLAEAPSDIGKELGGYLKIRRAELGEDKGKGVKITQGEMALKSGMRVDWYRTIEQGRAKRISLEKFLDLKDACELTPQESDLFIEAYKPITQ